MRAGLARTALLLAAATGVVLAAPGLAGLPPVLGVSSSAGAVSVSLPVGPPPPTEVGAAKADLTPSSLSAFYLGGYGLGPMHKATGVLRHIYARAMAIRDPAGHTVVITALDVQGHFLAYKQGPYGFADMAAALSRQLHIPATNFLFQSTHTHNGPDDLGVWGGVPTTYLAFVARQTEAAVRDAVRAERPATLRWAATDMTGFAGTFGPGPVGDTADYPVDPTLRVIQAVGADGRVIANLVNFASHATVYGPLNKVSPDWPGATATYLEADELGMPRGIHYGYPGSVAVVTEGDLGHTWPAGIPRYNESRLNPPKGRDANAPADEYGNAVARAAMAALATHPHPVTGDVAATSSSVTLANDNPVLLAAVINPVEGLQAYRADTPPYGAIDTFTTQVVAVRIGGLLLVGTPGEEFPTLNRALTAEVHGAAAVIPLSLAEDQLGYLGTPGDYVSAQECSDTDEGFFMVSPLFGDQVLRAQGADAAALGFRVSGGSSLPELGTVPASSSCVSGQLP